MSDLETTIILNSFHTENYTDTDIFKKLLHTIFHEFEEKIIIFNIPKIDANRAF